MKICQEETVLALWAQAVERDEVEVAEDPGVWVDLWQPAPPAIAFARNAGRGNRTNVVCLASSANARIVGTP